MSSRPVAHIAAQPDTFPSPIVSARVDEALPPSPRENTPWLIADIRKRMNALRNAQKLSEICGRPTME